MDINRFITLVPGWKGLPG